MRATLGARAELAQVIESIDPGGVAVAPFEMQSIVADRIHGYSPEAGRDAPLRNSAIAAEFVDAVRTRAVLPKIPGRVGTEVPVIPGDVRPGGTDALDQRRSQIRQDLLQRKSTLYHKKSLRKDNRMILYPVCFGS